MYSEATKPKKADVVKDEKPQKSSAGKLPEDGGKPEKGKCWLIFVSIAVILLLVYLIVIENDKSKVFCPTLKTRRGLF